MTMNEHKIIWSTFIKKFAGKTCKEIGLCDNESIISFDFFNFVISFDFFNFELAAGVYVRFNNHSIIYIHDSYEKIYFRYDGIGYDYKVSEFLNKFNLDFQDIV